ncbi:MAG TPA: ubiquinone biosynthesis hydroxylase [Bauldia sp.]|nr:ubiquinone biosynthesis hydroxylase [Bauldia sp.]
MVPSQRAGVVMNGQASDRADIVVAGGGQVGLVLGLALRRGAPNLSLAVVDAAPVAAADNRASAIAAAGRRMLEALGVWDAVAGEAQPIAEMIVTDSRTRDVARPVFLTFDGKAQDGGPFAHMVPNAALTAALAAALRASGGTIVAPAGVRDFEVREDRVTVRLDRGTIDARLLVAADGVRSRLRDLAGIRTVAVDYGQAGIVVTVEHERPHGGRAEEHFLPAGPFAILPLRGNRASLVWTEARANAERLVAADAPTFQRALERRFGHRLGKVTPVGPARAFPLGLTLARSFVKPRFALVGDAAHGIHPIAGQGLNLGYRDAAALAETIVDADRLGLDIGALSVLERYERWRRFDTVEMGLVTDGLNRLFSNDNPLVRLVRDVGLGIVDRLPGLKRLFMREAAGEGGDLPRLLRGEAI